MTQCVGFGFGAPKGVLREGHGDEPLSAKQKRFRDVTINGRGSAFGLQGKRVELCQCQWAGR